VVLAEGVRVLGNVVSGSGGDAILTGGSHGLLARNLIGTNAAGTAGIENHSHGIDVQADGNVIQGNVISDSGDTGLVISGTDTVVQGNRIGTDVTGTVALGNGFDPSAIFLGQPINGTDGIVVCAGGNTIGGPRAGQGNVVSANRGDGIFVGGDGNVVQGNKVGTDVTGTVELHNRVDGIGSRAFVFDGAGFCQQAPAGSGGFHVIGGTAPGAGNLVSGNLAGGIDLVATHGTTIAGNRIGTNLQGTAAVGNIRDGLFLGAFCDDGVCTPSSDNQVIGNAIGANGGDGIEIDGTGGGTGNRIAGNTVGIDAGGHPSLGNTGAGIRVANDATLDVIGGTASSDANVVAGNRQAGIFVGLRAADTGTHVAIQGNSTFANNGLGIDLAPTGVDCSTPPPGPNDYVMCPVITSASPTLVGGTACPGCTVEVFLARSGAGDAGHGEGAVLLVRTLAQGNGTWTAGVPSGSLGSGDRVTATATTPASTVASETSEFGANVVVG
jgi:parallel beta-helix repeat protein